MTPYWFALVAAIASEVVATTAMKLSDGMTRAGPATVMFIFYTAAGILIGIAMKRIDLSVAYGMWSGLGLILTTLIAWRLFNEDISPARIFCLGLIGLGSIGLYSLQSA